MLPRKRPWHQKDSSRKSEPRRAVRPLVWSFESVRDAAQMKGGAQPDQLPSPQIRLLLLWFPSQFPRYVPIHLVIWCFFELLMTIMPSECFLTCLVGHIVPYYHIWPGQPLLTSTVALKTDSTATFSLSSRTIFSGSQIPYLCSTSYNLNTQSPLTFSFDGRAQDMPQTGACRSIHKHKPESWCHRRLSQWPWVQGSSQASYNQWNDIHKRATWPRLKSVIVLMARGLRHRKSNGVERTMQLPATLECPSTLQPSHLRSEPCI